MVSQALPRRYMLRGHYFFNGKRGEQSGEIYRFNNSIFGGNISDTNKIESAPEQFPMKFALGVHFSKQDELAFLKIGYSKRVLRPVFWWTMANHPHYGATEFSQSYYGNWLFADDFVAAQIIEEWCREACRAPELSKLGLIPEGDLIETVFNEHNRAVIFEKGRREGNTGGFNLVKR